MKSVVSTNGFKAKVTLEVESATREGALATMQIALRKEIEDISHTLDRTGPATIAP